MSNKISTLSNYFQEYEKSISNPEQFWSDIADQFYWRKRWKNTLNWNFEKPTINWFEGGRLNITENIFEKQLYTHGDKLALIWEPNNPEEKAKKLTYKQLFKKVCQFANVLRQNGIGKGDVVAVYLPMIPELAITMLACARIGAIHSIVFAGFSSRSLQDRINDANASLLITADGGYRGNKIIPLKEIADEALLNCPSIKKVIYVERTKEKIHIQKHRDFSYSDLTRNVFEENYPEEMDSEDPLFILYTSGSTGKPKGIIHSTGGYMVYTAYTFQNVFQYNSDDVYFCTADIGWITGHSYIIYGPLLSGATTMMYEGVPNYPDPSRFWNIIEKHKVTHFYTAPTAIRALMGYGNDYIQKEKLKTLKVLGTVGEPINEAAWHWYHNHIGQGRCPVVDTWWQTETGGIAISPIAGITPTKPSYATLPLPGIQPIVVDNNGKELKEKNVQGFLCIKFPWPGMSRGIWGDQERFYTTYFKRFPELYFTGDGVKKDEEGYFRIMGRVDDVINVSGHRLGTAEIENAINENPMISESAVVGYPHKIKGEGICAFVVCPGDLITNKETISKSIIMGVNNIIGAIAKPDKIFIIPELPKTRSGKIMRRILRQIAKGEYSNFGDISTLTNSGIIDKIIDVVRK
ncbi:MAG: acetate--CoA ligase [Bacteroidales bacterium]